MQRKGAGGKKVWEDKAGLKPLCQFSDFTAMNFYSTMQSHPDKMNYPVMEASENITQKQANSISESYQKSNVLSEEQL